MDFFLFSIRSSAAMFLQVILAGLGLSYALRVVFRLAHLPNPSTSASRGSFSWLELTTRDVLFCLGALGALNLILYWLPT
jgi:hypothetical protein